MIKLTITTGNEQAFFEHGPRIARALDRGESLPAERVLRFEDPAEMMRLMHGRMREVRATAQSVRLQADVF